jgi:hypothetical protein
MYANMDLKERKKISSTYTRHPSKARSLWCKKNGEIGEYYALNAFYRNISIYALRGGLFCLAVVMDHSLKLEASTNSFNPKIHSSL